MMTSDVKQKKSIPGLFIFAALIIVLAGIFYAASIITPLLMAFFISIVFAQPIFWLKKKKVPQGLAIAMVFLFIIGIFVGFGDLIGNSLSSFSENAPQYEENLSKMGEGLTVFLADRGINLSTGKLAEVFDPSKVMSFTAGILGQLGGFMGNAFTIFFLVLFLLLEMDVITKKTNAIAKSADISLSYLNNIGKSIRNYLSIKTLTSLLTGVLVWIFLAIIGIDYAIIWALIAFLLNYIPNIGSIIAAIPAVLFSLVSVGYMGVVWTSIVFLGVNMLVGNVVEPKMMGKGMGLSTFIVFVSLIFWGFILGTVGMFLSVPLTMAIKIVMEQNPHTKWIAVVLGTEVDANKILDEETSD